jgi:iron complex outermembrane receptor protein
MSKAAPPRHELIKKLGSSALFGLLSGVMCLAAAGLAGAAELGRIAFSQPTQALDSALLQFAEQADMDIVGLSAELASLQAPALDAVLSPQEALEKLLANTGLFYSISARGAITISTEDRRAQADAGGRETLYKPSSLLEEVTVSATRRETNLQQTPIAVSAASQAILNRNQVKDLRDMTDIVPGLEMTNTGPQSALLVQLRGIGTTNITEIADGPVALHMDGVYSPRSQGAATLLYDISRVEVLRGPQGTLFGRNSTAGTINIYTQQPQFDTFTGELAMTLGNYQQRAYKTHINAPLSESLALRFALATNKHSPYTTLIDNYVGLGPQYPSSEDALNDYQRGRDVQGPDEEDQTMARLSLAWLASENLDVFASVERYTDDGSSVTELDPSLVERGQRVTVSDSPAFIDMTNDVFRSRLNYQFENDHVLSYIGGWARMRRQQSFDLDKGRDGSYEQQRTHSSDFNFFSHELQLVNRDDAKFRWILGVFYSSENNGIVFALDQQNGGSDREIGLGTSWISEDPGAAVAYFIQPERRVRSVALFAQGTYHLNENERFTLGLRRTEDTKSDKDGRSLNCRVTSTAGPYSEPGSVAAGAPRADQIYADEGVRAAIIAGLPYDNGGTVGIGDEPCWVRQVNDYSATWRNTSGLLRYEWDLQSDIMAYASLSTGFKSGHIQDSGNEAKPEAVVNYELGLKSTWLDGRLRMNAALYQANYKDLQFSNRDRFDTDGDGVADSSGSTIVRNAAGATMNGMEFELEWALSDLDYLQMTLALVDAEFDDFQVPDTLFGDLFNPYVSGGEGSSLDAVDLSGNSPVITPDWKLTFVYERDILLAEGVLRPRFKATFSDEYFLDIYNRTDIEPGVFPGVPKGGKNLSVQEAYATFDLSLHYAPHSGAWSVEAFVNNFTDQTIKTSSGTFLTEKGMSAIYTPPRVAGVSLSYTY